ncbi:MAG: hypothetical protein D6780_01930, partial [Candidatus Dadabacteria bacterium]
MNFVLAETALISPLVILVVGMVLLLLLESFKSSSVSRRHIIVLLIIAGWLNYLVLKEVSGREVVFNALYVEAVDKVTLKK